MLDDAVANY
jgi:hypothetical protein